MLYHIIIPENTKNLNYQSLVLIDANLFMNQDYTLQVELTAECSQLRRSHSKESFTLPLVSGAGEWPAFPVCPSGTAWMTLTKCCATRVVEVGIIFFFFLLIQENMCSIIPRSILGL